MLLCVPASVGLWMTSSLLVSVLFERGAFTAEQGAIVAGITKIYAFTLIGASLTRILGQAFYAEKKTSTPAVAAFVGFIIHLLMAPLLMEKWGINGLVISTSLSSFINCFVLLGWFYVRHGSLYFSSLSVFLLKMVLASVAIVGVCWLQSAFYFPETFFQKSIALLGVVFWSAILFFLFAKILRVEEADWLLQKIARRASKR
jgi:putative peptidoglycan lipid II flippase